MNLIFLDELFKLSGYRKRESVESWLVGMKLRLVRVGRNYAVDRELFEKAFEKQYKIKRKAKGYEPIHTAEKKFLNDLTDLL